MTDTKHDEALIAEAWRKASAAWVAVGKRGALTEMFGHHLLALTRQVPTGTPSVDPALLWARDASAEGDASNANGYLSGKYDTASGVKYRLEGVEYGRANPVDGPDPAALRDALRLIRDLALKASSEDRRRTGLQTRYTTIHSIASTALKESTR